MRLPRHDYLLATLHWISTLSSPLIGRVCFCIYSYKHPIIGIKLSDCSHGFTQFRQSADRIDLKNDGRIQYGIEMISIWSCSGEFLGVRSPMPWFYLYSSKMSHKSYSGSLSTAYLSPNWWIWFIINGYDCVDVNNSDHNRILWILKAHICSTSVMFGWLNVPNVWH